MIKQKNKQQFVLETPEIVVALSSCLPSEEYKEASNVVLKVYESKGLEHRVLRSLLKHEIAAACKTYF